MGGTTMTNPLLWIAKPQSFEYMQLVEIEWKSVVLLEAGLGIGEIINVALKNTTAAFVRRIRNLRRNRLVFSFSPQIPARNVARFRE